MKYFLLWTRNGFFTILGLSLILLSGCIGSTPAIHEYALYSTPYHAPTGHHVVLKQSLILMPVELPSINASPALLLRPSLSTLQPAATHLWAGSLQEQLTRVLAQDIRRQQITETVFTFPGPRFAKPDMLLEVKLTRFDGDLQRGFTCRGTWTLSDNHKKQVLAHRTFSATVPVNSGDYSGYVSAASSAVAMLSDKIGAFLTTLALEQP